MTSRKTPSKLSESVHQQVNMYAIAASAAGVSLLALARPVEAKIVYTPANVKIGGNQQYNLDLNHDGIIDFVIQNRHRSHLQNCGDKRQVFNWLSLNGNGNGIQGIASTSNFTFTLASALNKGAKIGVSDVFVGPAEMAQWTYGNFKTNIYRHCKSADFSYGHWVDVEQKYLGLKFLKNGKTHYGWARLNVQLVSGKGIVAQLTGYAYETIPGKSMVAGRTKDPEDDFVPDASLTNPIPEKPEPASLGMLALGAQGVPLWRREEEVEVAK